MKYLRSLKISLRSPKRNLKKNPDGRHIIDYWKKQTRTLRISENIYFTSDDVMKYVIGAFQ